VNPLVYQWLQWLQVNNTSTNISANAPDRKISSISKTSKHSQSLNLSIKTLLWITPSMSKILSIKCSHISQAILFQKELSKLHQKESSIVHQTNSTSKVLFCTSTQQFLEDLMGLHKITNIGKVLQLFTHHSFMCLLQSMSLVTLLNHNIHILMYYILSKSSTQQ